MSIEPCPICDEFERYTANGGCVSCTIARSKGRHREHRAQIRKRDHRRWQIIRRLVLMARDDGLYDVLKIEYGSQPQPKPPFYNWLRRRLLLAAKDDGVYDILKANLEK